MILKLLKYSKNMMVFLTLSLIASILSFCVHLLLLGILIKLFLTVGFSGKMIAFLILLGGISGVLYYLEQYLGHYAAFKILADLRMKVYHKLRELGPAKLDTKDPAKLLALIHTDIELSEVFFAHTMVPFLSAVILTGLMGVIYGMNVGLIGILLIIPYLLIGFCLPLYRKKELRLLNQKLESEKIRTQKISLETIQGKRDIFQLGLVALQKNKLLEAAKSEERVTRDIRNIDYQKKTISLFVILAFWSGLFLCIEGSGQWNLNNKVLWLLFPFSFNPQLALSNLGVAFGKAIESIKNIVFFLEECNPVKDGYLPLPNATNLNGENVTFHYPTRESNVLKDIAFSIPTDKIVGITGNSGSGKSTIMKLIMKWYAVQEGNIYFDDTLIDNTTFKSVRSFINYVPQVPQFFSGSLRENLTLRTKISDELIWDSLKKVGLYERIRNEKQGLNIQIKSENVPFSSGEKQRLELCRAILHPCKLLILDEPTSNLDSKNEQLFLEILESLQGVGIIIITHRDEPLKLCQTVYQVFQGKFIQIDR